MIYLIDFFFFIYFLFRLNSVGRPIFGLNTKLYNPDSNGEGEICMSGRHIFMGYLNEPQKTNEVLDADGWLHSGDLGKFDSDGFLYITGIHLYIYKISCMWIIFQKLIWIIKMIKRNYINTCPWFYLWDL